MFRRIWQKTGENKRVTTTSNKKEKTGGLSFALYCWRNSTLFAVLVCHQLQHNTRSSPSSPVSLVSRVSLSLCVSWLLRSHTVAREKRRGYRRVDCDVRERRTGKEQQRVRALQQRLSGSVTTLSEPHYCFNVSHIALHLTMHLVHQKLVALDNRAAKKLRRTKVRSRKIERKQVAVWNGFPNLISSRVFLACLFVCLLGFVERQK
jgi:hypothetical protein